MVALTKYDNRTLRALEGQPEVRKLRPYLGMSMLGHSCNRYLWYYFRWCYKEELEQRILRLFDRGDREENAIIERLKAIGIQVWGEQLSASAAYGHSKCHIDGLCLGVLEAPKTTHLLEMKTMNDKYFKQISKQKLKEAQPKYYAQMQIYMLKFKLTRGLFVAVNKNDDHTYIERVKFDRGFAEDLERKAESIVLSEKPPVKPFKPTWYECRFCSAKLICHYDGEIEKNCRTCAGIELENEGRWKCTVYNILLATDQQRLGCEKYRLNPLIEGN